MKFQAFNHFLLYNKNLKLHSLKDIVEEFNNYFLSMGKNLSDNIPAVNRSHDSLFTNEQINWIFIFEANLTNWNYWNYI